MASPRRTSSLLLVASLLAARADTAEEDAALMRMLTLQRRSLVSDRPLPVGGDDADDGSCPQSEGGNVGGASAWAAALAASDQAELDALVPRSPAVAALEDIFAATATAVENGRFPAARQSLQAACAAAQALGRAWARPSEPLGASRGDAAVLEGWFADCSTLLGYMPLEPPVREDHKRLLMLLHDLGGGLLMLHLHGALSVSVIGARTLGSLSAAIGRFGEANAKTALTAALELASRSSSPSSQLGAAESLRAHGLCAEGVDQTDLWSAVGARACATLLLRGGRERDAVAALGAFTATATTMHSFLAAFELAGRLPHPPRRSGEAAAARLRFTAEHMLEVLEAVLQQPQHGLASEANLLAWQLRVSMNWGQAPPPLAPPLACAPPPPPPPCAAGAAAAACAPPPPRVLIAMPFVAAEQERLTRNLGSWADGGGLEPCGRDGGAPAPSADLALYLADAPSHSEQAWLASPARLLGGGARCFGRVFVRHANLTRPQQHYVGGWDNTGPNGLFYSLFFDEAVHEAYDALLWMEADVVPVAPRWLERVLAEAAGSAASGYWRKGPAQQPLLAHSMVSTHHYHMNSAGLYRLGQPCFVELMRRVAAEYPKAPHDVCTHLFLHEPRHFHLWQRVAHRFQYTDLVQNRLDMWTLDAVRELSPGTVLVHGKHRSESG